MSTYVFPSLIGQDIAVDRQTEYRTTVFETVSGKEQRVSWWDSPRYSYTVKLNIIRDNLAAPAPYAAASEVATVLFFIDQHLGRYDSFLMVDPVDGTQRTVRLLEDTMTVTKFAVNHWECEFKLKSVK